MLIKIRYEEESDTDSVYELNFKAFDSKTEPEIVNKLRKDSNTISLVADLEGKAIGNIVFSRIDIVQLGGKANINAFALGPMAVHPTYQNQGIGHQLVQKGIKECKVKGIELIVVLGHPNFYPKFGFESAFPLGIISPFGVESNAWMCLELTPGVFEKSMGKIKYNSAFMKVQEDD